MSGDPDDEALRWEGDDDPTLAPGWKRVGRPVDVPAEARDAGAGTRADAGTTDAAASGPVDTGEPAAGAVDADEPVEAEAETEADAATQPGSAELVLLGVFGGVYLLYTIGWILTATGFGALGGDDPVASFMFSVGLWLAVLAPALWYAVAFAATRGRPRVRLVWLLAGAIVLVPLPFVMGVTA
ncbi:DNA polymerase III subunit gamma/tau [Agromyces tardus]|jgi:hypothetical protein|uniref:DNA polymerase III subunit gamma/tau n=1 Tax=Agromyces tardus TaxID=2583849 RepID=A0A3M8AFD2_9MICO|nr:DNA polymerase III subunit gamma/tau [Agromyces tardus]RNB49903.1 DNA polymerase III subunit gamma/tau [Agromyces tardus]